MGDIGEVRFLEIDEEGVRTNAVMTINDRVLACLPDGMRVRSGASYIYRPKANDKVVEPSRSIDSVSGPAMILVPAR